MMKSLVDFCFLSVTILIITWWNEESTFWLGSHRNNPVWVTYCKKEDSVIAKVTPLSFWPLQSSWSETFSVSWPFCMMHNVVWIKSHQDQSTYVKYFNLFGRCKVLLINWPLQNIPLHCFTLTKIWGFFVFFLILLLMGKNHKFVVFYENKNRTGYILLIIIANYRLLFSKNPQKLSAGYLEMKH